MRDAKMDKAQIHDIVLVGGSTCIPKIQKLLQDFGTAPRRFEPTQLLQNTNSK